jgi:hypothetical protein
MEMQKLLHYLIGINPNVTEEEFNNRWFELRDKPFYRALSDEEFGKMILCYRESEIPFEYRKLLKRYGTKLLNNHFDSWEEMFKLLLNRMEDFPSEKIEYVQSFFKSFKKNLKAAKENPTDAIRKKELESLLWNLTYIEQNVNEIAELEIEEHRFYLSECKKLLENLILNCKQIEDTGETLDRRYTINNSNETIKALHELNYKPYGTGRQVADKIIELLKDLEHPFHYYFILDSVKGNSSYRGALSEWNNYTYKQEFLNYLNKIKSNITLDKKKNKLDN